MDVTYLTPRVYTYEVRGEGEGIQNLYMAYAPCTRVFLDNPFFNGIFQ